MENPKLFKKNAMFLLNTFVLHVNTPTLIVKKRFLLLLLRLLFLSNACALFLKCYIFYHTIYVDKVTHIYCILNGINFPHFLL